MLTNIINVNIIRIEFNVIASTMLYSNNRCVHTNFRRAFRDIRYRKDRSFTFRSFYGALRIWRIFGGPNRSTKSVYQVDCLISAKKRSQLVLYVRRCKHEMLVMNKQPKQMRDISFTGKIWKKLTASNVAFLKSLSFIVRNGWYPEHYQWIDLWGLYRQDWDDTRTHMYNSHANIWT